MAVILGLGDCNMGGAERFAGKTYMQLLGQKLKKDVRTYAITMSTTREGKILFEEYHSPEVELVIVAFGLVDSWRTFKYAPYVLYYPDNVLRKLGRKLVKKYKKIARRLGLNEILGQKYVVPPKEYKENLRFLAQRSQRILFIETPPHLVETFRNPDIQKYNALMQEVAKEFEHADVVKIYDEMREEYYLDEIHFNQKGYGFVANKILEMV